LDGGAWSLVSVANQAAPALNFDFATFSFQVPTIGSAAKAGLAKVTRSALLHRFKSGALMICPAILGLFVWESSHAQTSNPDRVTVYNLRKSCAEEARRWLKSHPLASPPNDEYYSYKIHYSVKLNGCFVLQSNMTHDMKYKGAGIIPYQRRVIVTDIHSDEDVAEYWASYNSDRGLFIHGCRLPPDSKTFCKIHGSVNAAPVDDRDTDLTKEWSDAVKPYMEE
jgi:hypothetical protein